MGNMTLAEQPTLEKYEFNHANVRVLLDEHNDPWFVAKDVCDILGLKNSRKAIVDLDDDEKNTVTISDGIPGNPNKTVVSEAGLYKLIMRSRKPEAREFQRWVTHEVLPTIRKHGAYMSEQTIERTLTDPDYLIRLATQLKKEKEARVKAEARLEEAQPQILLAQCVQGSETSIPVSDMAKILHTNGVNIGVNAFYDLLRDTGFLCSTGVRRNLPTARSIRMGIMEIKETPYYRGSHLLISRTARITGRGQAFFIKKYVAPLKTHS